MTPKYNTPNESALFIGRSETNDQLQEYWVLPPSGNQIHVFIVNDNSGSFATKTLLYSQTAPVRTSCGWPEPNWFQQCSLGVLLMSIPEGSHYMGMEAIVFQYLWNMLYGEHDGAIGHGVQLHHRGHHVAQVIDKVARELDKAGMPLTEGQNCYLHKHHLVHK
jgi:hypothetical protein